MSRFDHIALAFVVAVAAFAGGAQLQSHLQSPRADSFAYRWEPVFSMPSEGMTIKMVDRWTH